MIEKRESQAARAEQAEERKANPAEDSDQPGPLQDPLPVNPSTGLEEMRMHLASLEGELDKRDAEIESLSAELQEKERQLFSLEGENFRLSAELQMMKDSLTWRLVMAFHRSVVERLLQRGTKRRRWYEQAIEDLAKTTGRGGTVSVDQLPHYARPDEKSLDTERATRFPHEPVFSIVVPVYNTKSEFLSDMVESVRSQTYSHWELCIVDGGSAEPHVRKILETCAGDDERIKVTFLAENRGISGNSNGALSLATGDFIALLDHDDVLSPSALFEVVKAINENPEADFLYSDYAITDAENRVHRAVFCPDFCRFFYLSHPYIVHLAVVRKSIIDKVGGFDEAGFNEGVSQDVDLFLRVFAQIEDRAVVHVPKILYFWKHYGKSAGHLFQDKVHGYTKKAITRYLASKKLDGWVEDGPVFNSFRVRFPVKDSPKVSIIIPTKDKWELLKSCIHSVEEKAGYDDYEIIVIKNNTEDKRAHEYLDSLGKTHTVLEYNQPFNYSAINNFGARSARGEFLFFLNDDIEFKAQDTLKAVLELIQLEDVGAVGAKLLYPDDTIQHAGVIIGFRGAAEHWHKFVPAYINRNLPEPGYVSSLVSIREYSAVTGAFLITKRSVFEEVGGFSEELEVGFNDIDLCLKIRAKGYRILYTPYALAYHHESASRRDPAMEDLMSHPQDRRVFLRKWSETIKAGDPCYNPNLDAYSFSPVPRVARK